MAKARGNATARTLRKVRYRVRTIVPTDSTTMVTTARINTSGSTNFHHVENGTRPIIKPNLYTYVFRPPALSGEFPFLNIPWIKEDMWPPSIRLPAHYYYPEPVAGVLLIVPLSGLTILMLVRFFWLLINGDLPPPISVENTDAGLFAWFCHCLLIYFIVQMFILLVFINSAMRYLFDVSPVLIVLSTLYVGRNLHLIAEKPFQVKVLASLWILASLLTVISGFFIGLTGERNNFLNQNPRMYQRLLEWFGG